VRAGLAAIRAGTGVSTAPNSADSA
jgi:hypothetical protein